MAVDYQGSHRFSVAPMMEWTDRHCRAFHRCFTKRALLYTEMVTADAIIFGPQEKLLGYDDVEHPVAAQLGGSDPDKLAAAAKVVEKFGYDEVNLNCGCPSDRVQSGAFGACLMKTPERVGECVQAMIEAVNIPVTVKCRIGVDDDDPTERLFSFVETVRQAGCRHFIVHARKAWLKGLSPKQNRDIPPLDYDLVSALKDTMGDQEIVLNGGLDYETAQAEKSRFDGVMLGRAAYHTPEILGRVDREFFGDDVEIVSGFEAMKRYRSYVLGKLEQGVHLHAMTRHLLGCFSGVKGARYWRRTLSEKAPGAKGVDAIRVFDEALSCVDQEAAPRMAST